MVTDNNQPHRPEGWSIHPRTQQAVRDLRERDGYIISHGLLAYVQEAVRQGRTLAYPFSDQQRWQDIADDENCTPDWRATARWLLDEAEAGRIGTWPDPI